MFKDEEKRAMTEATRCPTCGGSSFEVSIILPRATCTKCLTQVDWPINDHAQPSAHQQQNWWCVVCEKILEPTEVTFEETHDERSGGCGGKVVVKTMPVGSWKPAQPVATQALQEPREWTLRNYGEQFVADYCSAEIFNLLSAYSAPLREEIERLKRILIESVEAVGGYAKEGVSVEFLALLPTEIKALIKRMQETTVAIHKADCDKLEAAERELAEARKLTLDEVLSLVGGISGSLKQSRDSAKSNGRDTVALCRQSDVETCERIRTAVKELMNASQTA